jgi:outer membrane receptor for ferrienterochelin and colicins
VSVRRAALIAVIAIAAGAPDADAQPAGTDGAPAVDVADLPPLPPPSDDRVQTATLYAASEAAEDVVVGAAKREQSLGNVASAVTVITADRLRRFGYRTVAEALRAVAGVHVVDDHLTDRVGIRGLQILGDFNTRVLVLIDGATLNEMWGAFAGVGWDMPLAIDDIARIEVIRGPVSSVYGTNAFFGIINIVTRGAAEAPRAWGRITGSTFQAGAVSAGFSAGGLDRQIRGSVVGLLREGETLSVPGLGDDLDADGIQSVAASVVGQYQGAFAQLRFYRRVRELTFAPFDSVVGDDATRELDTLGLAEGGYTRELGRRLTVSGRAYLNFYRFSDELIQQAAPTDPFHDFGDAFWFGGEARARYDVVADQLGVTVGGEAMSVQTESRSYADSTPDADRVRVPKDFSIQGVYAEADAAPVPWLSATAGVRFDRNSILEDRLSPRAAVFAAYEDLVGLKLLYAEGFRNPSAFEAFFEDGTDFEANPELRAERIRSYEAVAWGRPAAGVSARVSGFHWRAERLVEQEFQPAIDRLQFVNRGEATSTGVELEVSYRDTAGWYGFAGGAVMRVRDEDDERVEGAPAVTASAGVSTPRLYGLGHLSTELVIVGPRTTRDPGVRADAFVGWNAAIYLPELRGFDVTIGARNLIGRREQVPAQEDYDRQDPMTIVPVLPGEGREVYARIGYKFD